MEQNSVKREAWEADIAKLADTFNEASVTAAAWAEINPFETEKSAVVNAQMETTESILQMMQESLTGVDIKFTTQKREMTLEGQTVTPECRQVEIAIAPVTGEIVEKVTETDENTEETETGSDGGILVQAQIKSDAGELYRYEARYAHSKTPTDIASFSWDDFASVPDYWMDPDGGVNLFGKRDIAILKEGTVMNPERAGVAYFKHTKIVDDGVFKNYTKLKSVRLTHAVSVGEEAFRDCEMLEEAVIPLCRNAADFAFAGCKALKAISLPQCASVGAQAFEDCQALTSVELPLCVSLNDGAFRNCENLTEISLPNCQNIGAEAFKGCKNLKKVSLPKCARVGNDAFKDCENLVEIDSVNVRKIGQSAFWGCKNLKEITLPKCEFVGFGAFTECALSEIDLPECTDLGDCAFQICSNLKQVNLPQCKNIGFAITDRCSSDIQVNRPNWKKIVSYFVTYNGLGNEILTDRSESVPTEVEMPECTSVGQSAFQGCSRLLSIKLPACTSVADHAFWGCSSLMSIELPVCTSVGMAVFINCSSLTSIDLPACKNTGNEVFMDCSNLTSINLPACTSVAFNAFLRCTSLTRIELPACTSVADNAFRGCSSVSRINLPVCTIVERQAFNGCNDLTNIELPACTNLGRNAFRGCNSLKEVHFSKSNVNKISGINDDRGDCDIFGRLNDRVDTNLSFSGKFFYDL